MSRLMRCITSCFACWLLIASATSATAQEEWVSDDYPVSMQTPALWTAFGPAVLDNANQQVRHITGRTFIAGYGLRENTATSLYFPYLLIQYKPYSSLLEGDRPVAKLDAQGKLLLLANVINSLKFDPPPTATVDLDAYIAEQATAYIRITAVTVDGRFDLTGTIPARDGSDPIHYHTHGVLGREGVALVSVFASEQFDELAPVIRGPLRTLVFDAGHAYADLPDQPPEPEPADPDDPDGADPQAPDAEPSNATDNQAANKTPQEAKPAPKPETQEDADDAATSEPDPRDSSALLIVIGVLGVVALVGFAIIVFISHKQAQARRERARARRERRQQQN